MKRLVYTWPIPEVQAAGVWLNQKHQFSSSSFRNIISTSIIYILCVFPTNWSSKETSATITRIGSVMFPCCFIATNGSCWKKGIRIDNTNSELCNKFQLLRIFWCPHCKTWIRIPMWKKKFFINSLSFYQETVLTRLIVQIIRQYTSFKVILFTVSRMNSSWISASFSI